MDEQKLSKIVLEAQNGSETALSEIYNWFAYNDSLYSCAYRILRNWEDDVGDVIQDCAIKVINSIKIYNPNSNTFANWCYSIIRNKAIDQLRKRLKSKEQNPVNLYVLAIADNDPHEELESKDLSHIIDEASEYAGLSQRQRMIWQLYRAGYDIEHIADVVLRRSDNKAKESISCDIWRIKRKLSLYLWIYYPDLAEIYSKLTFLFSIEPIYQFDLNQGIVPKSLREKLPNIPSAKIIVPKKRNSDLWLLNVLNRNIYLIRKENDILCIYG